MFPLIPYHFNLYVSLSNATLSKALEKSNYTQSVWDLSSMLLPNSALLVIIESHMIGAYENHVAYR